MDRLSTFLNLLLFSVSAQQCKNYPGDPTWPSEAAWQTLNDTVGGRLSTPVPLGAVCHPSNPSFSNLTCQTLLSQWSNTSFVANNPFLADYNDDTCSPYAPEADCSTRGYPTYIVSAAKTGDIQAGVDFARTHNLRLVIKGTGHDFPGRSSGAGSLSLYTHNLRGIEVTMGDATAVRYGGVASVKIAAGHRWREVYTEVAKHNVTIVGGADGNVGVGGWILNAGHSPLSSVYGLGADQVLSLEIVTADGQYLNVNETSAPDLFWALRGGGGSTFAVMLSVTVKAYPPTWSSAITYTIATSADSDEFWSMVAFFHSQTPKISEAGGMGYHYLIPGTTFGMPEVDALTGVWYFPFKTVAQAHAILDPIHAAMNASEWATRPLYLQTNDSGPYVAMSVLSIGTSEAAGFSGRLGSWLLDGDALTSNFTMLKESLKASTPKPWISISHVVAGPGVRNVVTNLPGGSNAVLSAWRKAYVHIALPRKWSTSNKTEKVLVTRELRNTAVPALKALAPESGAYVNEADPSNPDWKHDYFGSNYDRLLSIKHKYDPSGLFWCKPCVGWDEWQIIDSNQDLDTEELGVGQGSGRLCKIG